MNKTNREDIVELLYSDADVCILVSHLETKQNKEPSGRVVRKSKKELKKTYRKINQSKVELPPVMESLKSTIIDTFLNVKNEILDNTKEYIDKQNYNLRKEYFDSMTEDEYIESLEELKDDYKSKEQKKKTIKQAQKNRQIEKEMEMD